jgi:protein TonB
MDGVRLFACFFSATAHLAVAGALIGQMSGTASEPGSGTDRFRLESGIGIESVVTFGDAAETVAQTDASPPVAHAEEVQPQEVKEDTPPAIATTAESSQTTVVAKEEPLQEQAKAEEQATPQPVQVAQDEQQQATSASQSGGLATILSAYYSSMSRAFARHKINPRTKLAGTAVVRYSIDPSGRILSREIEKSSGSPVLDDAALKSVDRTAQLPPVPKEIVAAQPLTFSIPYNYSVR